MKGCDTGRPQRYQTNLIRSLISNDILLYLTTQKYRFRVEFASYLLVTHTLYINFLSLNPLK